MRPKLVELFHESQVLERLLAGVEPHLQTMYNKARDPMLQDVLAGRAVHIPYGGEVKEPAEGRLIAGLSYRDVHSPLDAPRLAYPELIGDDELEDYDDDWDDWPDEVEEA